MHPVFYREITCGLAIVRFEFLNDHKYFHMHELYVDYHTW